VCRPHPLTADGFEEVPFKNMRDFFSEFGKYLERSIPDGMEGHVTGRGTSVELMSAFKLEAVSHALHT
jgi:hypothetical protein